MHFARPLGGSIDQVQTHGAAREVPSEAEVDQHAGTADPGDQAA